MDCLWVAEYGTIRCGVSNRLLENGDIELNDKDFSSLLSLTQEISDGDETDQILTLYRRQGIDYLKVKNYVGVIRTPSGLQIEVLPKTNKRTSDTQTSRAQLLKMLVTLKDSPFREGQAAALNAHRMPLFELIIRYFLEEVLLIVKRGIARSYASNQGNLKFLRGKLMLAENIRRNACNDAQMYCEFDEYNADRPINRLIARALIIISKCSRTFENVRLCRELMHSFDGVSPSLDIDTDINNMIADRSTQHYAKAMPLCKLILRSMNPLTQKGSRELFALLFPMERVFESYVTHKLRTRYHSLKIDSQVAERSLVSSHGDPGRTIFKLRPDLMITGDNLKIIADTKWKLLDQTNRSAKYGISEADMYQLFAYGEKYLDGSNQRERVILIYPKTETFDTPLPEFWFDKERSKSLVVLPFDLETDILIGGEAHFLTKLTDLTHR